MNNRSPPRSELSQSAFATIRLTANQPLIQIIRDRALTLRRNGEHVAIFGGNNGLTDWLEVHVPNSALADWLHG